MATSFRDLKKSRDAMFQALNKQLDQAKKGGGRPEADLRFWYPQTDKAGNGYAVIRFLPAPPNEAVPYITEYAHGFQGPGGWYIQRSRTTLGKDSKDPVGEYNRDQWAKSLQPGNEHNKESLQAGCKRRKRNTSYIANILVIKDPAQPENEGKVFLFRYGVKLQALIETKMKPQFEGITPMNPFDPWDGADLELLITTAKPAAGQKKGFRNYDKSSFKSPSALGSDQEIETLWKQEHPLQPLIAEDTFEPYDKLKQMFDRAMGFNRQQMADEPSAPAREPQRQQRQTLPVEEEESSQPEDSSPPWNEEEDDQDLDKFRRLAGMLDE